MDDHVLCEIGGVLMTLYSIMGMMIKMKMSKRPAADLKDFREATKVGVKKFHVFAPVVLPGGKVTPIEFAPLPHDSYPQTLFKWFKGDVGWGWRGKDFFMYLSPKKIDKRLTVGENSVLPSFI